MKCKTNSIIIIITIIILSTSIIQAGTIKNETKDNVTNEESTCFGFIYGSVGNSHGVYTWTTYPFALVTSGIKLTRCSIGGGFFMFLSLYHVHRVTAHVVGFKPLTLFIQLTADDPIQRVSFDMYGYERESYEMYLNDNIKNS